MPVTTRHTDGRILVEVASADLYARATRFNLRVREHHAALGTTIVVRYPDGAEEPYNVVGLLEPRPRATPPTGPPVIRSDQAAE